MAAAQVTNRLLQSRARSLIVQICTLKTFQMGPEQVYRCDSAVPRESRRREGVTAGAGAIASHSSAVNIESATYTAPLTRMCNRLNGIRCCAREASVRGVMCVMCPAQPANARRITEPAEVAAAACKHHAAVLVSRRLAHALHLSGRRAALRPTRDTRAGRRLTVTAGPPSAAFLHSLPAPACACRRG